MNFFIGKHFIFCVAIGIRGRMQLRGDPIKEFQKLWKKEMGEDLPEDEAREYATRLVRLVASVCDADTPYI